jgi:hypothetical protein
MRISYNYGISHEVIAALDRYVNQRIAPGDFLTAVLCNDLRESIGRADQANLAAIHGIVSYVYSELPSGCWGSPERFRAWMAADDREVG